MKFILVFAYVDVGTDIIFLARIRQTDAELCYWGWVFFPRISSREYSIHRVRHFLAIQQQQCEHGNHERTGVRPGPEVLVWTSFVHCSNETGRNGACAVGKPSEDGLPEQCLAVRCLRGRA